MTNLGAGHDTVHLTINCAFWEMCKHPDVQKRLRHEIRQNLKDPATVSGDASTDAGSIDSLPYPQAVCDEVLRLHHSGPTVHHVSIEPTTANGQVFPKPASCPSAHIILPLSFGRVTHCALIPGDG